jgi:hypothetical protein
LVLLVLEKQNPSKHLDLNWVDSCLYSIVTRPLMVMLWEEFLWVFAKSVPGVVSTNSTDLKSACFLLYLSRSYLFRQASESLLTGLNS